MRVVPLLVLSAVAAHAGPPPMSVVSLKKTAELVAARPSPDAVDRDAKSLVALGLLLGLDQVSVQLGLDEAHVARQPDVLYATVSWHMWAACNHLSAEQQKSVAALLPTFDAKRPLLIAWAQLNSGQVAAGRAPLVARLDELLKQPASYQAVMEGNQVLGCVGAWLSEADRAKRRAALDALTKALPPLPPG